MVPALVSATALSLWSFRAYATQLDSMRAVRESTFAHASGGCDGGVKPSRVLGLVEGVTKESSGVSGGFAIVLRLFSSVPGIDLLTRPWQGGRAASAVTNVADGWVHGVSVGIAAKGAMACNEPIVDGDLKAMKKLAADVLNPVSP